MRTRSCQPFDTQPDAGPGKHLTSEAARLHMDLRSLRSLLFPISDLEQKVTKGEEASAPSPRDLAAACAGLSGLKTSRLGLRPANWGVTSPSAAGRATRAGWPLRVDRPPPLRGIKAARNSRNANFLFAFLAFLAAIPPRHCERSRSASAAASAKNRNALRWTKPMPAMSVARCCTPTGSDWGTSSDSRTWSFCNLSTDFLTRFRKSQNHLLAEWSDS